MLAGFPIYADPNKAFWYPLRLLRYVPDGFNAYIVMAYALAAWAAYGYVRGLTGLSVAGITAATTFALGGFMISHLGQPMVAQPAAWACVAIWSLDTFLRRGQGRWLLAMALAEAFSIASGQPQIAAFSLTLLFAYLLWVGYAGRSTRTLRVYLEGAVAIALGVTLGAVALLPAIALGTMSVRSGLDFGTFVADAVPIAHLARMLTYPFAAGGGAVHIYPSPIVPGETGLFTEATCYVGLAALALAALAPFARARRVAVFWCAVAAVAIVLAVGDASPLAALTYALPGFNLFRIPGRHAFEFTFAVSICAGLGVSAIALQTERRFALPIALVAIAIVAAIATVDVAAQDATYVHEPAVAIFLGAFALQFALLCIVAATRGTPARRAALACAAVFAGALSFALTAYWRDAPSKSVIARPGYVRLLERLPLAAGERVYTASGNGRSDLQANLPMIWDVPNVGGYTPLQLATVHILLQTGEDGRLLDVSSRMVDLASVRYFAVTARSQQPLRASAPFGPVDLQTFLSIGRPDAPHDVRFGLARPERADRVALVTALGASVGVSQGETVATLTAREQSGKSQILRLRAGIETAEFAYDRPDVRSKVRHRRARLYERDGSNTWYVCSLPLRLTGPIASIEIRMVHPTAALNVRKASLIDTNAGRASAFSDESQYLADRKHFRRVAEVDGVSIFENLRSVPAVRIVGAIPTALTTTSDADLAAFRERLQALKPDEQAFVTDHTNVPTSPVRGTATLVTNEAERRVVRAECPQTCLLVSSATFSDDWTVAVDGRDEKLIRADGMLQGVAVPAGTHRVEFRYRPWAGRLGVALSTATVAILLGWLGVRRKRLR